MSRWGAIIATGVIFGIYHLDPFTLVPLCVLGIYLSYLVSATGSILVPVAAHFTNNFVSSLVYYSFGKDSLIAPSDNPKLAVGHIVGWSVVFALIFYITIKSMIQYSRQMSNETKQEQGEP